MDRREAERLLGKYLARYRQLTYAELVSTVGSDEQLEIAGESGTQYQIEVQFMWEDKRGGDIRVSAGIDDGSIRGAFRPVCEVFIVRPDGRLMGE